MTHRRSSSQPRPSARHSGRRAPPAWRDPALWAWVAVAVFALLPLTHAVAAPMRPAAAADTEIDDLPVGGMMGMPAGMPSVKKLSDNELSCTAIYLEVTDLERTLKAQEAATSASQREMQQAATAMMDSGAAMSGVGVATGLLGMIPGVGGVVGGMVSSVASQAASAAMASVRERQGHMMDTTQKMVATYQAQAAAAGRRDHLTDLFLARGCKLAQVKAALAEDESGRAGSAGSAAGVTPTAPAAAATSQVASAPVPATAPVPAAPVPATSPAPAAAGGEERQDQASAGGGGTP